MRPTWSSQCRQAHVPYLQQSRSVAPTSSRSSTVISPNPEPSWSPSFWPRFTCAPGWQQAGGRGALSAACNACCRKAGGRARREQAARGIALRMCERLVNASKPACNGSNSTCSCRCTMCASAGRACCSHTSLAQQPAQLPCLRDLLPQPAVAMVVLLPHVPRVLAWPLHAGVHVLVLLRAAAACASRRPPPPKPVVARAALAVAHLLHRGRLLLLVVQRGAAPAHVGCRGSKGVVGAHGRLQGFGRGGARCDRHAGAPRGGGGAQRGLQARRLLRSRPHLQKVAGLRLLQRHGAQPHGRKLHGGAVGARGLAQARAGGERRVRRGAGAGGTPRAIAAAARR